MPQPTRNTRTGRFTGSIGEGRDHAPTSPAADIAALHAARDRAVVEQTEANWANTRDAILARYGLADTDLEPATWTRQARPGIWTGAVLVRGRRLYARTVLGTTERALYRLPFGGRPLTVARLRTLLPSR